MLQIGTSGGGGGCATSGYVRCLGEDFCFRTYPNSPHSSFRPLGLTRISFFVVTAGCTSLYPTYIITQTHITHATSLTSTSPQPTNTRGGDGFLDGSSPDSNRAGSSLSSRTGTAPPGTTSSGLDSVAGWKVMIFGRCGVVLFFPWPFDENSNSHSLKAPPGYHVQYSCPLCAPWSRTATLHPSTPCF